MEKPLYKYEFTEDEANYLLNSVNTLQIRGVDQAAIVVKMASKLRTPKNAKEIADYSTAIKNTEVSTIKELKEKK